MKSKNIYLLTYEKQNITIECHILHSNRKSISIQISPEKEVIIRVPNFLSSYQLSQVLEEKKEWILNSYQSIPDKPELTLRQKRQLVTLENRYRKAAKEYIPSRVFYFQKQIGVTPGKIVIRDQKTRWGSCSGNQTLSFNYRLMFAPPCILDYVIVHELCHIKHMNHSDSFWAEVEKILPDYKEKRNWLKQHGQELTLIKHLF